MRKLAIIFNSMLITFVTVISVPLYFDLKSNSGTYRAGEFCIIFAFVFLTSLVSLIVLCSSSIKSKKTEET